MDPIALFEQKQTEATIRFWNEVDAKCRDLKIAPTEAKLALLTLCGMTPWEALTHLLEEWPGGRPLPSNATVSQLRPLADEILKRQDIKDFKAWARQIAEQTYAIDLQAYDWKRKDSELELRYLIDVAKERIEIEHRLTPATSNAILNSVKELNAMYRYSGASVNLQNAKAVIFVGEDALPD